MDEVLIRACFDIFPPSLFVLVDISKDQIGTCFDIRIHDAEHVSRREASHRAAFWSRTHGLRRTVSDTRSRTLGLGHAVSDTIFCVWVLCWSPYKLHPGSAAIAI